MKMGAEGDNMEPAQELRLLTEVAELRSDVRHLQRDVSEIKQEIKQKFKDIDDRFKGVDMELKEIKDMIASAKLWAYGLYVGGGCTLLYVIARTAKLF